MKRPNPLCAKCEKPVDLMEHVEVTPLRILGGQAFHVGTHLYHTECFFDEDEDDQTEPDEKQVETQEGEEG